MSTCQYLKKSSKIKLKIEERSKEKNSLTRMVVRYRIGGNGGVKRKGTRFWENKNPILSTSFGSVTFTCANYKYRIFVSFFFSQNLVPFLFTPSLPPIPISHQLSRYRMFFFSCVFLSTPGFASEVDGVVCECEGVWCIRLDVCSWYRYIMSTCMLSPFMEGHIVSPPLFCIKNNSASWALPFNCLESVNASV